MATKHLTWAVMVLGLGIALGAPGCAGGEPETEIGTSNSDELLNGAPTNDRPEIGRISGCTATLVRPNVVITAAHCVDYVTREEPGNYGRFTVDTASGQSYSFVIERFRSFSNDLGDRDVTLMRLREAVPPSVAIPTDIAERSARQGETVTVYGYGCTDRGTRSGSFTKRKHAYAYGRSANLCPGDSGGPVVLGDRGPVFLINSGYYTGSGTDIFGKPYALRTSLLNQIETWDTNLGAPQVPEAVSVVNATGAPLYVRCDGSASPTCSDWALLQDGQQGAVFSPGRRLVIDNQGALPDARFTMRRLTAPGDEVIIYANADDPLTPPAQAPPPQSCLGADDRAQAPVLSGPTQGRVCAGRDTWLGVPIGVGQQATVTVAFSHASGDIDMVVYDPDGQLAGRSSGTTDAESVTWTSREAGVALVRIYGYSNATNDVTVTLDIAGSPQQQQPDAPPRDDCQEPDEPNDDRTRAGVLSEGQFPGGVCRPGDEDWYSVELTGAWRATLTFDHAQGDLDMQLFDAQGRQLAVSQGTSNTEQVNATGPGFVRVYGYSNATGAYTLDIAR